MNIEKYTDKEIEEIVESFKVFFRKIVKHSAIDFVRKIKGKKYQIVSFDELVEPKVLLSHSDNDIFCANEEIDYRKIESYFEKDILAKAVSTLTNREKKILFLYSEKYSVLEIARKMNTTANCIKVTQSNIRNKIKKKVEELENEKRFKQ